MTIKSARANCKYSFRYTIWMLPFFNKTFTPHTILPFGARNYIARICIKFVFAYRNVKKKKKKIYAYIWKKKQRQTMDLDEAKKTLNRRAALWNIKWKAHEQYRLAFIDFSGTLCAITIRIDAAKRIAYVRSYRLNLILILMCPFRSCAKRLDGDSCTPASMRQRHRLNANS